MYAKVRKIKVGTLVKTKYHEDMFVDEMAFFVGKVLQFRKIIGVGWYVSVKYGYCWHKSWLIIRKPSKKARLSGLRRGEEVKK